VSKQILRTQGEISQKTGTAAMHNDSLQIGLIDAGGYVMAGVDKDGRCERTFIENNVNVTLDLSPERFLKYNIFRKTKDYPKGGQRPLFQELDDLIDYYRNKAKGAPVLFGCRPGCGWN
jgi:DNA (cytosine-5)-methyltransferase 1